MQKKFDHFLNMVPDLLAGSDLTPEEYKKVYQKYTYALKNWNKTATFPAVKTLVGIAEGLGVFGGNADITVTLDKAKVQELLKKAKQGPEKKDVKVLPGSTKETTLELVNASNGVTIKETAAHLGLGDQAARQHLETLYRGGHIDKRKKLGEWPNRYFPKR